MVEQRHRWRFTLAWWSLAVGLAAALKVHFSAAAVSDLDWMLLPVSLLLQLFAGWNFEQSPAGEWYSLEAGIILVKACAGSNFMLLSLLGWCWVSRPRYGMTLKRAVFEWPLLLSSAFVLAWTTALTVNTLRILAIVHWQPVIERWLPSGEAHRLVGLLIYLAALNLQMLVFDRRRWRQSVLLASGLYGGLMLAVPVLTGNAHAEPALYFRHAAMSLVVLAPLILFASLWRGRRHAEQGPA